MTEKELTKAVEELNKRIDNIELRKAAIEKPLYTIEEVAKIFGVTKEAIYKRIKSGDIPAVKWGTLKIRATDLYKLLGTPI